LREKVGVREPRRVFVVGVPRSGTTLVQSLLAAHSRVTSFTESHFFSRHFRLLPLSSSAVLVRDPAPRLREFLTENGCESALADGVVPPTRFLPLQTRGVARRFLRLLDELAVQRAASVWLEKTPRHLRYVPFLERVSGRERPTRFVHVIRGGVETVASLYKASRSWERPYDLESCVRRWNEDVAFSLKRAKKDRFVFYEELTTEPVTVLRRLLAGLGLDWQPEILERYAESSGRLITGDETWKEDIGRVLRPSATSEEVFTEAQRDRVDGLLRHDLYRQLHEQMSSSLAST
jgi:hypothetical protein